MEDITIIDRIGIFITGILMLVVALSMILKRDLIGEFVNLIDYRNFVFVMGIIIFVFAIFVIFIAFKCLKK